MKNEVFLVTINFIFLLMRKTDLSRAGISIVRYVLLLFVASGNPVLSFSQQKFEDSILKRIETEKNDTEQVRLYVQLGNRVRQTDTAQGWRYQRKVSELAEKKNNDYLRAQALLLAGTINIANRPLEAIRSYEKALKLFEKYPDNKKSVVTMGAVYINLGLVHNGNSDYETAVRYYLKAEEIYRKHDPKNADLAILYSNLSITYGSINKHTEGLIYSKKGLEFARANNDKFNLMNSYYAYGGNLVNALQSDSGLLYLDSAKALGAELNNLFYIYSGDFMKGLYYYKTKQFAKAKECYLACLAFAKKYQSTPDMGNNYLNISAIELETKRPRSAKLFLDSAKMYLDLSTPSFSKKEYFENYAEMCRQLGDYATAFAYKDSATALKDSLYQADNIKQTEFRQARYNYEKQQHEIDQLGNEKRINELTLRQRKLATILLSVGIIALLLTGFFAYRTYRHKQKLQQQRIHELETEKQLAATEAVLKGEEQERTRLAKDLHDGLGGMLSGIKYSLHTMKGNLIMTPENAQAFERSIDMLDSSIFEMRRVAHNMMPEALVKFGLDASLKDFCNDITQTGALNVSYQSIAMEGVQIEQTRSVTVYRIVQELVNNIIKHAGAKNALVQLNYNSGELSVTVEDDGHGFEPAILKVSRGIGWSNIQNRVEFLKGKWDVDSKKGKGTSVHVVIPG